MTSDRRFEQELPGLLDQLAYGPLPDYRNEIVRQTAHTRQRPAWMHPERWLHVTPLTTRVAAAPRFPWRLIALAALLILVLAVGATLVAGSRQRIPVPFGPAGNGAIAYAINGDIYTADHATGAVTAVSIGAVWDVKPVWADDGTRFVFERMDSGGQFASSGSLIVMDPDGSHPTVITPTPLQALADYAFSPAGTEVMFTTGQKSARTLWLAKTDGSGVTELTAARGAVSPAFLAPSGVEIVFATTASPAAGSAISGVNTLTGEVRSIVQATPGLTIDWVRPSPDGTLLAYSAHTDNSVRNTYEVHVVGVDGTGDRQLPIPAGATFQDGPEWSNDSASIAITRGFATRNQDIALAVVPADGSGTGTETIHGVTGCCDTTLGWSPDDLSILVLPEDLKGQPTQQLLWNPLTGATARAPWQSNSPPSWQRTLR